MSYHFSLQWVRVVTAMLLLTVTTNSNSSNIVVTVVKITDHKSL